MTICFFGDSISFGQGISVDLGWVTQIAMSLRNAFPEKEITVVNTSVNGNTTRMALERMPFDVQSHDIDMLIIGFGMNDCNYWQTDKGVPRVSDKAFEANLEEIIERAFNVGIKYVCLRTNHPSAREDRMINTNITYAESNEYYNTIIRKIAEKDERIIFCDIEAEIKEWCRKSNRNASDLTLPDNIHLNLEGHNFYYDKMYPIIKKCVNDYLI